MKAYYIEFIILMCFYPGGISTGIKIYPPKMENVELS